MTILLTILYIVFITYVSVEFFDRKLHVSKSIAEDLEGGK
jgi:hypothetical protein